MSRELSFNGGAYISLTPERELGKKRKNLFLHKMVKHNTKLQHEEYRLVLVLGRLYKAINGLLIKTQKKKY